jgi:hypothetical protein
MTDLTPAKVKNRFSEIETDVNLAEKVVHLRIKDVWQVFVLLLLLFYLN